MKFLVTMMFVSTCAFAQAQMPDTVDASTARETQMQMAESAAPKEISSAATILVLGKQGYEVARTGTNRFTCLISRQRIDTVEPECHDAAGSATTLKVRRFVEAQRAKGVAEEQIEKQVEAGYKSGRFKAPQRPGIVYMLSPYNRVFDPQRQQVIHFPGHLMFHAPYLTDKDVGKGEGAPYLTNPGKADNLMVVIPK